MVSWKIFRESAVEVVGKNLVELVEKSFKKKGKEIDPSKIGDILYKHKKIDESEKDLLNEAYELLKQEEEARTIPGDSEEPEHALTFADDEEIFAQERPGLPKLKKFTLVDIIGQGGMGRVYKGVDTDLGRPIAVKEILGEAKDYEKQRFQREILLTAKLDKEHRVIRARAVDKDDKGNTYFVMDFVEGKELTKYVENIGRGRTYSLENAIELLAEALDAMSVAHKQKIIHRDIKPDNIMADRRNVKIMDWGLAKEINQEEIEADEEDLASTNITRTATYPNLTHDGQIMGTPAYMSPEQAMNAKFADERSDVYSFGAILYKMLTGESPNKTNIKKKRKEEIDVQKMLVNLIDMDKPAVPPSKLNKNAPPELESICMKALEKDAEKRYQTAEEFRDDLKAYLKRDAVTAHNYSIFSKISRFVQKHPTGTLAAFLGTMLISGGIFGVQAVNSANLKAEAQEARAEREAKEKELQKAKAQIMEIRAKAAEKEVKGQSESLNKLQSLEHLAQNENYYSAALQIINEAIQESEQFWKPYLVRAKHQAAFGKHKKAEQDFEKAQELFKEQHKEESVEIWFEAGMYYGLPSDLGGKGESETALQYFEKAANAEGIFGKLSEAVAYVIKSRTASKNAGQFIPRAKDIAKKLKEDDTAKNINATWLVWAWIHGAAALSEYEQPAFFKHQNLPEAKRVLERIIDKKSGNYIKNFLSIINMDLGNLDAALETLNEIIKVQKNPIFLSNRGVVQRRIGNFEKALTDLREAAQLSPQDADIYSNIGIVKLKQGKIDEAMQDFHKAIEIDPSHYRTHYNLGAAHLAKNDLISAKACFNKALSINKHCFIAHFGLGELEYTQKNWQKAREHYTTALQCNPKDARSYCHRGKAYKEDGDLEKAISDYNNALQIKPDYAEAYHNRGLAYAFKKDLEQAISDYNKAIKLDKNHVFSYLNRGVAYQKLGKTGKAKTDYKKALELNPKTWQASMQLGTILLQEKEYKTSLTYFKKAHKNATGQFKPWIMKQIEWINNKIK